MTAKFDYELPNMFYYDGMWSVMPAFPARTMEQARSFPYTSDDVIIATYRKAGTTWLSRILDLIYNNGDADATKGDLSKRVRCLELFNPSTKKAELDILRGESSPRLMSTHLPARYLTDAMDKSGVKVIFVMRNPKDNYVSYFHHYKINKGLGFFPHSWDDYFELIKAKKIVGGDWYEFNSEWWAERRRKNVHVMTYESLKRDPVKEIGKMASFCGRDLHGDTLERIASLTQFSNMMNNADVNFSLSGSFDLSRGRFIRKGEVGDWKNYWTKEQNAWFDAEYLPKMEKAGLQFDYELTKD